MERAFNITQIIEQLRLGYIVPKQVDIAYSKLKCTAGDVVCFDGPAESGCPIFASKFCHLKNNEHIFAAANEDGKILLHNASLHKKDNVITSFDAHDNAVFDVAWTNSGMQLISASGDHSSTLWQISEGYVQSVLQFHGHQHSVRVVTCKPDDQYVFATGARDGALLIWDTRVPEQVNEVKPDVSIHFAHEARFMKNRKVGMSQRNSITAIVFQDDNTLISSSASNGFIKVWDMRKTYSVCKRLPQAKFILPYSGSSGRNGYSSLAISPCRLRLYANCIDDNLYCYNIGTYSEKPIATYSGHRVSSFYIKNCVSPDGRYIASGSNDGKTYVWSASNPTAPLVFLSGHDAEVTGVDWCKAGEPMMVTCSDDATCRLWRINSQEYDSHDTTLRGYAEIPQVKVTCPEQSSSLNHSSHMDLIPRQHSFDESSRNEEVQPNKKRCLDNSLDMSSLTSNLPNYVLDGLSPHIHRCTHTPKMKDGNWLEKLKKKSDVIHIRAQHSPRRKCNQKGATKQSILRFFKVSSRPVTCDQSSSSASESKNGHRSVRFTS